MSEEREITEADLPSMIEYRQPDRTPPQPIGAGERERLTGTDLGDFTALLDRFGVDYSTENRGASRTVTLAAHAHEESKVVGYSGFVAEFCFSAGGSFDEVGIWE